MVQYRADSNRLPARARGGVIAAVAALLVYASPAWSQAAPPAEEPDSVIRWNFQPVSVATEAESLEERWSAPFAVESRGRPAPRSPRPVVVLRDSVAAPRVAAARAAAAGSTAEGPGRAAAATGGGSRTTAATSAPAGEDDEETEGERPDDADAEPTAAPAPSRPSPPAARTEVAEERARTHRVEYGETWLGLARQYRVSSDRLAAANPGVDPERLRSGTVLRIPPAGATAGAAATAVRRTHTVTRGDTLFGIARRYGVSPAAIRTANRLTGDVVRLGQTLVIPREEASR